MLVNTKRAIGRLFPARVIQSLRRMAWEVAHPWIRMRSDVRVEIVSSNQWILFTDIFVRGEYDLAIDAAIAGAGKDFVAIDLGANIGYFSLRLADRYLSARGAQAPFTIYAVEGANKEFVELKRRLDQPALKEHVRVFHALVGKRSGQGVISHDQEHTNQVIADGSGDEVPYVDLDDVISPGKIDLVKCDIEGSEEAFADNYRDLLGRARVAVFELHGDRCDVVKCEAILAAAGFTAQRTTAVNGPCRVVVFTREENAGRTTFEPA